MYNRYIRNDRGSYTRITEDDGTSRRAQPSPPAPPQPSGPPHTPPIQPPSNAPHTPPDAPPPPKPSGSPHTPPPSPGPPKPFHPPPPGNQIQDALSRFIRHFLRLSHMDNVDTGDMLVLLLLFLLYREGADEETLVALGLLLVL